MTRKKTVDDYIASHERWRTQLERLRVILNATPLAETIKWGAPCYTFEGKNVVGIGAFKAYFGLWFFQGALLNDTEGVLCNAQEGKTKALRQWRMTATRDIKTRAIKAYVREAIELQKAGKEIKPDRSRALRLPIELEEALANDAAAAAAFEALTPGRQREYADHVGDAKRAQTRMRRLAKVLPMIAAGKGLHDKYRDC